jgi:signal transduction histidine kinase
MIAGATDPGEGLGGGPFARALRLSRTIGFRLATWYSLALILTSVILFGLTYLFVSSALQARDREDNRAELHELAALYEAGGLDRVTELLTFQTRTGTAEPFLIRLTGPGDTPLLLWKPDDWADIDLRRIQAMARVPSGQWSDLRARDNEGRWFEVTSLRLPDGSLLEVGGSTEGRDRVLGRFRQAAAWLLIPIAVLGFSGGVLLASRALQPIRRIVQTVRAIEAGSIDARVPTYRTGDELDELSMLFNSMLEKISFLIRGMRSALDNVAHDLRTPIARIRGVAEVALRSDDSADDARQALAECVEESDHLLTMLNTLMDISEAESGALTLNVDAVNLAELVEGAADLYRHVAEEKGVALSTRAASELWVAADRTRLRQVLANLLDNAIKYTPAGGRIEVTAEQDRDRVVVRVADTGIGMTPDELPRIWERLYRGDQSRSQRGLGLGLSLVRAVVEAHRGRIEVSSVAGGGSVFTVVLPLPAATIA